MLLQTSDYVNIVIKTVLSVLLGGLIGLERQNKHRPAGFRTHILVSLGSMAIMVLSELMFDRYQIEYNVVIDPSRIPAQVISGIGFLGAGTIIHYGANVRGLTTAASLWTCAAIGMAVGAGFYFLAVIVSVAIFITLVVFNRVSNNISAKSTVIEVLIQVANKSKAIGSINQIFAKLKIKILDLEYSSPTENDAPLDDDGTQVISMHVVLQLDGKTHIGELLQELEMSTGVIKVERI